MTTQTSHVDLQKRFHFLTTSQRNKIFNTIKSAVAKYEGLHNLTRHERDVLAHRLGRKYGVPKSVIVDVYEYVTTLRHEAEK